MTIGAVACMTATFGAGTATADDPLVGKTYADASAKISEWKSKPIISTVVGGTLETDKCVVTSWRKTSFAQRDNFDHESGILLALDCNATLATAGTPGGSAASPEGRKQKALEKKAEYLGTDEGLAYCKGNMGGCRTFCKENEGLCSEKLLSFLA